MNKEIDSLKKKCEASLNRSKASLAATDQLADMSLNELQKQTVQIERIKGEVEQVSDKLDTSRKLQRSANFYGAKGFGIFDHHSKDHKPPIDIPPPPANQNTQVKMFFKERKKLPFQSPMRGVQTTSCSGGMTDSTDNPSLAKLKEIDQLIDDQATSMLIPLDQLQRKAEQFNHELKIQQQQIKVLGPEVIKATNKAIDVAETSTIQTRTIR